MRKALVLLGIAGVIGTAQAADRFGAIAYSPTTGAWGSSYDHPTRVDAERAAYNDCRKRAEDCQIPLHFKNACGALAVGGDGGWGTGWGTDRSIAESWAIKICGKHARDCAVLHWVCTTR
jgi:serine/threonine-protein kinase